MNRPGGPTRDSASAQAGRRHPARPVRILVVDEEPGVRQVLESCALVRGAQVEFVEDAARARARLAVLWPDVVLIEAKHMQGAGAVLAEELMRRRPGVQTLVLTRELDGELAVRAIRAGVSDILTKPLKRGEVEQRLRQAVKRARRQKRLYRRLRHLERLCRELDQAREDISRQVDALCGDLVAAYQELAQQMQQAVQASEFQALIRQELDLEQFVRKVLEFVLEKAGPTNAALFLPASLEDYTLAGYVNYDCSGSRPEALLEEIGEVVAAAAAREKELRHLTSPQAIEEWLGRPVAAWERSHVVILPCRHQEETLAVLVVFRDASEPFTGAFLETLSAVASLVGDGLARIIRIHHRHLPDVEDEEPGVV